MKRIFATLGLLIMMGMSMSSVAFAAEFRALANAEQLNRFSTTARERCGGDTCPSAAFLQAFTGEAERQGLLGSMSRDDYQKLLQNRYPVLTASQVSIKAIEDLALTGLVLPDARALGHVPTPEAPATMVAPATATQPSVLPTVKPAEAMATEVSVDVLQAQLTAVQGELAALKAKPESSLRDDERQKLTALPREITTLKEDIDRLVGNKVEISAFNAFLQRFGLAEGQQPVFATKAHVENIRATVNENAKKHNRLADRVETLENAPTPTATMPLWTKIALGFALLLALVTGGLTFWGRSRTKADMAKLATVEDVDGLRQEVLTIREQGGFRTVELENGWYDRVMALEEAGQAELQVIFDGQPEYTIVVQKHNNGFLIMSGIKGHQLNNVVKVENLSATVRRAANPNPEKFRLIDRVKPVNLVLAA